MKRVRRCVTAVLVGIAGFAPAQNNAVTWSSFSSGFAQGAQGNSSVQSVLIPVAGRGAAGNSDVRTGFLANPVILGPVSSVSENDPGIPLEYALSQNYPNPFNPETEIGFTLQVSGFTSLRVYDLLGREVAVLADGEFPAGVHKVSWNASRFPSGAYFYRLEAGGFRETRKLVLLR